MTGALGVRVRRDGPRVDRRADARQVLREERRVGRRVGHSRGRRVAAALTGLVLAVAVPALALAHPLGNFTINHYAGIRVEPGRVVLDVVIDQAEIPTFQEQLRIDTNGDGLVSDAETEAERLVACPTLANSLSLTVAGAVARLTPIEAGLSFLPGAAGLPTMRLVCVYTAALPQPIAAGTTVDFRDGSHAERIGWREIVVQGSGVSVSGALPTISVSDRLRAYPQDLLRQPLDVRAASFGVSPGGPALAPLIVADAERLPGALPLNGGATRVLAVSSASGGADGAIGAGHAGAVPGGVGAEISGLLQARDLTPIVLVGSILAAMALGAGHALTPGHGKTLMGAYLVGTRGTAVHAVALGLSVTVSHTIGILVLAGIVIGFRDVVSPETFNRIAPVASGVLVLGIGGWLVVSQVRARRWRRTQETQDRRDASAHEHQHEGTHDHEHTHEGTQQHEHTHARGVSDAPSNPPGAADPRESEPDDAMHSHGGLRHSHLPAGTARVGWRNLFVLGLAGGVIPSTNALIILLSTIATGRAVYGLVLVVAFGLGMAIVLGGVGLALVFARDRVDRLPSRSSLGRLAPHAPLLAGALVLTLGVYLTGAAIGAVPTL